MTRKVFQIEGDYDLSVGNDGGSKYMPILGIWQLQCRDKALIVLNEAVRHRSIHQIAGALELFLGEVGAISQEVSCPFVVDVPGPSGGEEPRSSQPDQEVTQRSGVENACVVDDDETHSQYPMSRFWAWSASS